MTATDILIYVSDTQFRTSVKNRFAEPVILPTTTVSAIGTDYPAASWTRGMVYVSDGTSNKRLAVSDGTQWRWPDGNIVT